MTDKKLKIEFAPGAFDHFDGTQEELDELLKELSQMFEGKTADELADFGRPISDEEFDELPEDVKMQIMMSLGDLEVEDLPAEFKRTLQ